jgi:drug/metabolite transporter (DMT)-like permease
MVGVCTSFSFLLGNKAYVYLDPGFLQMMKAATPALLMFSLILFRVEKITLGVSLCSLIMVGGSIMACIHSPHVNAIGIAIQLSSQFCEVGQNVLIQFFMQRLSFTAMDAGYYIAPMSTLCCLILACSLESDIVKEDGGQLLISQIPWLCASGLVGIAVNFSSFFVIQYISSLMAKLIVVARSAGLVTALIFIWHEDWKPLQLVGYAITLVAFGGYSALKAKESKAAQASKAETEMTQSGVARSPRAMEDGQGERADEPLMGASPSTNLR